MLIYFVDQIETAGSADYSHWQLIVIAVCALPDMHMANITCICTVCTQS